MEKIKLYTHCTPSHEKILQHWLLPTAKEFEVVIGRSPQLGSGTIGKSGWGYNTKEKAKTMYWAVAENFGQIIVWADCDIQILRPIEKRLIELLGSYDIACQHDGLGSLCSGFFVTRSNQKTINLFKRIMESNRFNEIETKQSSRKNSLGNPNKPTIETTDQYVLNQIKDSVNYQLLPCDEFWMVPKTYKKNDDSFQIPKSIRIHHACRAIGIKEKWQLLESVRKQFQQQKSQEKAKTEKKNNKNITRIFITANAMNCHRRRLDATRLINYFKLNGCLITQNPKNAEFIIFVTCAFHKEKQKEGLETIKNLNKYNKKLLVTGCLPETAPEQLKTSSSFIPLSNKSLDTIDSFFPNFKIKFKKTPDANLCFTEKNTFPAQKNPANPFLFLAKRVFSQLNFSKVFFKNCTQYIKQYTKEGKTALARQILDKTYSCPNLRISRGCLGNCAYCSIRKAIGKLKSKPLDECLKEYVGLLKLGQREFVITADDTGSYGIDINSSFAELIEKMSKADQKLNVEWHILELHPRWLIKYKPELLKNIKTGKIKHILCPIQSGSPKILRLMNRYDNINEIEKTLFEFKNANPNLLISSHFIIGFPQETNKDFQATLKIIKKLKVFPIFLPYSDWEKTLAYNLPNKVDVEIIKKRLARAEKLFLP